MARLIAPLAVAAALSGLRAALAERRGTEIQPGSLSGQDRRHRRCRDQLMGSPAGAVQALQGRRWYWRGDGRRAERPHSDKGAHVRVKGRVNDIATFGGQAVGLHLEQTDIFVQAALDRSAQRRASATPPLIRHAVIRTATAVMSSFGGVSPRQSCDGREDASTTRAAG